MKYIDLTLSPTARVIHPVDEFIWEYSAVEREVLMHVDARIDGPTALLYRLAGDRESFVAELGDHEYVHDHEIVAVDDDGFHAFVQVQAGDRGGDLVDVAHRHALIIDTPLKFVEDGIRATLVGTHENLRDALGAIPDEVEITIRNAGDYVPGGGDLLSPLTDRQLEVVRTAVEEGYYDVPSRATQDDIADALGCATSTVDEHLRKAEAQVASALVH